MANPGDGTKDLLDSQVDVDSADDSGENTTDRDNPDPTAYMATLLSDLLITVLESQPSVQEVRKHVAALYDFCRFFDLQDDPAYDDICDQMEIVLEQLEMHRRESLDEDTREELLRLSKRFRDVYLRADAQDV